MLSDTSALRGAPSVDHCVVWCALLKQRTFARVGWLFFVCHIFPKEVFGRVFAHFSTLSHFHCFLAEEGQRDHKPGCFNSGKAPRNDKFTGKKDHNQVDADAMQRLWSCWTLTVQR